MFKKGLSAVLAVLANQQADWTLRLRAIEKLHGLLDEDEDGQILDELNRHFVQINHQLLDLRSKVCNQACIFVCACVQKYGGEAEGFADRLISKDSLLKLLSNGNKVLAEAANETLRTVVSNVPSERYFGKLMQQLNSTKNVFVREKLSECLNTIIESFDEVMLEGIRQGIEKTLLTAVCDSSAEVRKNARTAFHNYGERFPQKADQLLRKMDPTAVKAIKEQFRLEHKSMLPVKVPKPEPPKTGRIIRQQSIDSRQQPRDVTPEQRRKPPLAPNRELHQITMDQNKLSDSNAKPKRQSYNNYVAKETQRTSQESRTNKSLSNYERSSLGTSSKRARRDKPVHDWRTEDLEFLMSKADCDVWATRMMAFQKTYEVLMDIDRSKESIHQPTLAAIIGSFAAHLEDPHVKISSFLVGCMPDFVDQYPQLCAKHSQVILRRCLKGLAECKTQQTKDQLDRLLGCCQKYLSLDLMPHLLQFLQQAKTSRQRSVSLDFLIQLLQSDPDCMETKNVGLTVRLMGNLILEYHKEKSISLPALAVMSLVKAKHSTAVLNCLLSIGQNVLSKILELAGEIEPELEGSILRYIQSVDDPLKRKLKPQQQPPRNKPVSKVCLEELLNDKYKSNQCVELLIQQLHQHPDIEALDTLARVVNTANNLNESSLLKVLELLKLLTKQEHLEVVVQILDQLCSGPLNDSLLRCLCQIIAKATGPLLETYLQKLSNLISQVDPNEYYKLFDHLQGLIDSLKITVRASSAEARRLSIVTLADLYIILDEQAIIQALQPSEQRLVQLYVQRRKQRR